jgi:hypothetical protein
LVPRIERRRYRRPVVSWATGTSTLLPTVREESSKVFCILSPSFCVSTPFFLISSSRL